MLEDKDLREIRSIVASEIRDQLSKISRDILTEPELKRELNALEDRIVKRLS